MPYTRYTLSGTDIASMYGKNNTQFRDAPNAGVSGTSGLFGRLGALEAYSPTTFNYQAYQEPLNAAGTNSAFANSAGVVSESARRADIMANVLSQLSQAGQVENAQRGQAILSGYNQRIANNRGFADQQMGYVDAYGDSQRNALNQQFQQQTAAARQSALRRGLGNTTIQNSLDRGVNADYARASTELEDTLLRNRLGQNQTNIGLENQLTMERLGFLSGVQNPYPTANDYFNPYLQSAILAETAGSRR